jgi:pimeloyl-ACP methyl ester carboxylesterase
MNEPQRIADQIGSTAEETLRAHLLAGMPVTHQLVEVGGVSTSLLEGGEGPCVVLLHEQGEFAERWMRVMPELVRTHRVVAPDLPGHGASLIVAGDLTPDLVVSWLAALIDRTCISPPTIIGHMVGGSIAARFAIEHPGKLDGLVLVDSFGLARFRPSLRFVLALVRYLARPSQHSHERMLNRCMFDLDAVRTDMGSDWDLLEAYLVDRIRVPSVKSSVGAMMKSLGVRRISREDLLKIVVPTTLIWGRHDPVTRLRAAQDVSARFGWPLDVIDDAGDDPPVESPAAFVDALRRALERT